MIRGELSSRQMWQLLVLIDEIVYLRIEEEIRRGRLVAAPQPRPLLNGHISDEDCAWEQDQPGTDERRN